MSQRTPSAWPAMSTNVSIAAWRSDGENAFSWATSGHGAKYGSRPAGDDRLADREERRRIGGQVVGRALHEALGVLDEPRVVGGDVVGHEVDEQLDAAAASAARAAASPARPPKRASTS